VKLPLCKAGRKCTVLSSASRQCDDGAISEGYSDSVGRLLSDGWATISQLDKLVARDAEFGSFALGHIDETMSPAQARKIDEKCERALPAENEASLHRDYRQAARFRLAFTEAVDDPT
jgi:hypothetical protein